MSLVYTDRYGATQHRGLDIEDLPIKFSAYRSRYVERDARMQLMDQVVRGQYGAIDPEEDDLDSKSANLVQVALEDTAEAAALMPTLRVRPARSGVTAKKGAAAQERIGTSYFEAARMDFVINQTGMDLGAFGFGVWAVWPDYEQRIPIIEKRDPRHCFPQPGYRPGDRVKDCIFAREMFFSQLDMDDQVKIRQDVAVTGIKWENAKVTIVEYWCEYELVVGALYQHGKDAMTAGAWAPVELDRIPIDTGVCPIVIGSRFSLDGEFRGQYDQVVGPLLAHVRLNAMVLDYADQAVYSDVWVKDLVGEMPYGGGAYIELGPQGAIGRVPPAVTSLNIQADMQNLVDAIHVGGRWPKSRPGEIDQAIASAKFLEATAGMMNTAIKTYHLIFKRMMEQALRIAFGIDAKYFPGQKTASGILRNQEFFEEYDSKDIDLGNEIRVEYGLGLGRDPSQSAVLQLQYSQGGYVSKEFVQENIDGLTDVAREQSRIDVEQLRDVLRAKMLQQSQAGQLDDKAVIAIAKGRADGKDLIDLYEQHISAPAAEAAAGQVQSGLGGPPMTPGPPGAAPPGGPPGQPGLSPPPPPAMPQLLSRLGVPAGPGGLLGSQTQTGG